MNEKLLITLFAALLGFIVSSCLMVLIFDGDIKTVAYCGLGSAFYVIIRVIMISRD